eukprot:Blabericola_migrator_1__2434@NODE_1686_length_4002_cov_81_866582_g1093_i0_p2_GENE_NODE_1686_length_4002_cov_81_866582_g1093_i0NODE_1686_length_4002_cov_81_866582_g1093_i0_p2_ORF_typecomplete_len438_score46_03Diphthamide_syn/PF01866_17/2_9e86SDH_sah/PF01972_16/45SDH_sah/PF01972_16/4_7_NODE_1686_length_4002_cov_81_866582_g1093_i0571370
MSCLTFLSDSQNKRLAQSIELALPKSYNFEIAKTLQRLHESKSKTLCLQFPEGLMVWAEAIALILEEFSDSVEDVFIIGDVTYGACCIDDIRARALGCDFLIHYAHSCLIPIDAVTIKCLYVFVEIYLDPTNLANYILSATCATALPAAPKADAEGCQTETLNPVNQVHKVALLGSVQFSSAIHHAAEIMSQTLKNPAYFYLPQCAPLTAGETLGCTSPKIDASTHTCVFVADGRFHVESAMIQNPHIKQFLRFDPFLKKMFRESYDRKKMLDMRQRAIEKAQKCDMVCVVMSTLGRQGSVGIMETIQVLLRKRCLPYFTIFMSEMMMNTLNEIAQEAEQQGHGICFVQIGCPRLSCDWGHHLEAPLLSPYESFVFLNGGQLDDVYPMDYFARDGGPWSNYGLAIGSRDGSLVPKESAADTKTRLLSKWRAKRAQMS